VSTLHEEKLPLGAQHFPFATSQITVPLPSSQQSELSSQALTPRGMQQVPGSLPASTQVAFGSQQSESTLHESEAPVGAQHFPASQITAPKVSQQSLPTRFVHPVTPRGMQHVPSLPQVAIGSQQSAAWLQERGALFGAQHLPASQNAVPSSSQQSDRSVQPGSARRMQHVPPVQLAVSPQQSEEEVQDAPNGSQH